MKLKQQSGLMAVAAILGDSSRCSPVKAAADEMLLFLHCTLNAAVHKHTHCHKATTRVSCDGELTGISLCSKRVYGSLVKTHGQIWNSNSVHSICEQCIFEDWKWSCKQQKQFFFFFWYYWDLFSSSFIKTKSRAAYLLPFPELRLPAVPMPYFHPDGVHTAVCSTGCIGHTCFRVQKQLMNK